MLMRIQLASSGLTFEKGHQVSLSPVQTDCKACQDSRQSCYPIPSQKTCAAGEEANLKGTLWEGGSIQRLPWGDV